jgi:putative ABC transport system permease protein
MDLGPGYTFYILWHERGRFLPGILAVAFSALLITVQSGMLLGLFSIMSIPVDHASREYKSTEAADIWIGHPDVLSVDLGQPIPEVWVLRLAKQPELEQVEVTMLGFGNWSKPYDQLAKWKQDHGLEPRDSSPGRSEACTIIGSRLSDGGAGVVKELQDRPDLRARLSEPGAVVVDESEKERLGLSELGDVAAINGHRVRLVGWVKGLKAIGGPFVFCNLETARQLLRVPAGLATFLLGRCRNPADARAVAERLRAEHRDVSVFTSEELSYRTRMHWLTKTRVGIAMGITALLGLIVGAVITSQTLYGATVALRDQFTTLVAMGIPRRRIFGLVLSISFWVGMAGIAVALPVAYILKESIEVFELAKLPLPWWLLLPTGGITLLMALALSSGAFSLRALELSKTVR